MGVNTTGLLNTQTEVYASYKNDAVTKNETAAKKDSTAKTEEKNESGVVYDKSDSSKDNKKATYSINKMSAEDRAALVQQMKADTQSRQQQLISIVQKMMTGQAATSSVANGTNSDNLEISAAGMMSRYRTSSTRSRTARSSTRARYMILTCTSSTASSTSSREIRP